MNRVSLLASALVIGFSGAASAELVMPELLVNPGFEDTNGDEGFGDGWASFGAAGFNAFFGANGHASLFSNGPDNSGGVFQTGIAGVAGTEYVFELTDVLIESNADTDFSIALEFFAADDATLLGSVSQLIDLANPDFTLSAIATEGTVFVRPVISFANTVSAGAGSENIFIFDASLTAVPEPGSLALMAAGTVLLARRKRTA